VTDYQYTHPDGTIRYFKSRNPEAGKWVVFYKHPNAKLWLYKETVVNRQQHEQQMAVLYPFKPDFHYAQMTLKEEQ
jgi:hypothetical protein